MNLYFNEVIEIMGRLKMTDELEYILRCKCCGAQALPEEQQPYSEEDGYVIVYECGYKEWCSFSGLIATEKRCPNV
jgi:hypothetical protein